MCCKDTTRRNRRLKPKFIRITNANETPKPYIDELVKVQIENAPKEFTFMSVKLTHEEPEELTNLLKKQDNVHIEYKLDARN